jgi:hypothetical protein
MKLGLKTIVLALLVALLCVPAAFAKGHEGGHGHGRPSWAGQGKSHEKKAKLDKVHATKAKHEKKQKHQKAGSEDAAADAELNLEDLNPAWKCFMVESMMDEQDAEAVATGADPGESSSFDAEFGTNDNKRNSHGKCVSEAAHGNDVSAVLGDDEEESCDEPADDGSEDPAADEGTDDSTAEDGTEDSTIEDGTEDSTVEDGTEEPLAGDPAADDGSEEPASDAEECESDDSAGADDQAGEDDQAEDDQAEDDQGDETEVAAFARALVRFIKL